MILPKHKMLIWLQPPNCNDGDQQSHPSRGVQSPLLHDALGPLPDTPQLLVAKSHCHQALTGFFQCHTCADAEAPAWQPRCTLAIHLCHILSPTLLQKPFPTLQTHNTFAVAAGSSSPGQTPSPSLRLPAQEMPLLVTAPRLPQPRPAHPFPSNGLLQQQLLCKPNCSEITRMPLEN